MVITQFFLRLPLAHIAFEILGEELKPALIILNKLKKM